MNVFAFYSGTLFAERLGNGIETGMLYSFGFGEKPLRFYSLMSKTYRADDGAGAVNFVFGLLAVRFVQTGITSACLFNLAND